MADNITINIGDLDFLKDEWITLHGFCKRIGIYSNGVIFVKPIMNQFYFDSTNELLFVRYTDGNIQPYDSKLSDDYAKLSIGDDVYSAKLRDGGIKDANIGVYHDVYSIDNITGFFN